MISETDFLFPLATLPNVTSGKTIWESPSNIALVKYWGKLPNQIPANPSISFTLANCKTTTSVTFEKADQMGFEVWMNGERKMSFEPKIQIFLEHILPYCPYLEQLYLVITTSNTFPHGSGIASSASGLSALSLCIMDIEKMMIPELSDATFFQKASFLARLGSGSAARSVYGGLASWGESERIVSSSDLFATPFTNVHPVFQNYQDAILLIDEGEKKVSSTVGHNLMHDHPYAENRFNQAKNNLAKMSEILISGSVDQFIGLVESEALTLHAMMMTSMPYFILMKSNTLKVIEKVWEFREETKSKLCFTLDAGANVHLLYPNNEREAVESFINEELAQLCQNRKVIFDHVGTGPNRL